MKALGHGVRTTNFLVDLHAAAGAHYLHITAIPGGLDYAARLLLRAFRNRENAMAVAHLDRHGRADGLREPGAKAREVEVPRRRAHRELYMVAVANAVYREARAVRTTVAHGGEHGRHHATELRLKSLVLQKKTYNSAHFPADATAGPAIKLMAHNRLCQ